MSQFSNLPKVIYVMGPPGAGKGTQAHLLSEKVDYHQFSTGDAFRKMRKQDTDLGRAVKYNYDRGILQPPELAAKVVIEAVRDRMSDVSGFIFDGTPRTMKESGMIDDFFQECGLGTPLAIFLKVDRDEMLERIGKRRFCLGVESDFPVFSEADKKRCEELGGTVGRRPDDDPEEMATRWDEYMNRTYPVVEKYKKEGILHELDGLGSIEDVHEDVMSVVSNYK